MLFTILNQGLIYGLLALGVYITYKILDFPDLTVDGSLTLGATTACMLIVHGVNPILACLVAMIAGSLAGAVTGCLHVFGKISNLLSSIITMTMLYSINLKIMDSKANVSIAGKDNIYNMLDLLSPNLQKLIIILIVIIAIKLLLNVIMNSKFGLLFRSVGTNPALVTSMGASVGAFKIIGLAISNSLVALAGALIMQLQLYADIGMAQGPIVLGLTCTILGLSISSKLKFLEPSWAVIIGSIIYQAIIVVALFLGLPPIYLKFTMAVLLILLLVLGRRNHND